MPQTYTPSVAWSGIYTVWNWPGRAYDDPYAYVNHDNKIIPAYELAELQSVALACRDGFLRRLFSNSNIGLMAGMGPGLQSLPVSKSPPIVRRSSFRITRDQSGQAFVNTGAAGVVIASLPRLESGLNFKFIDVIGSSFQALPNNGNIVWAGMSSAAGGGGSGYLQTADKGIFELHCDGSNWQVTYINCSQSGLA